MIKSNSGNIDKQTRINSVLLAGIFLLAFFLRLWNLGKFGFWTDELFHVIAARSYIENGNLFVPFTGEYTRAYPYTLCVALSFKIFGISEFSARLPSVFFSMVFLVIAYCILKRYFDGRTALTFSFFMAVSPFAIEMSRECRMYTLFQTLYFLTSFAFLRGFESSKTSFLKNFEARWQINLTYLLLSGLLLLASKKIHELSLNFAVTVISYCAAMILYVAYNEKLHKALLSKYTGIIAGSGLALLGLHVIQPEFLEHIFDMAIYAPEWAKAGHGNYGIYKKVIFNAQPVLFFLYPLGILLIMQERFNLGTFIFASFIVLIIVHTFVFGRKNDRYIFYIFPFFIMGASFLVQKLFSYLYTLATGPSVAPRFKIIYFLAFLFLLNAFLYPQHDQIISRITTPKHADWKTIPAPIKAKLKNGIVFTTRIREYYYYVGVPPDFWIRAQPFVSAFQHPDYTIQVIDSLASLSAMIEQKKDPAPVYFVVDKWTFKNEAFIDSQMREFLRNRMKPIPGFKDHQIMIFTI